MLGLVESDLYDQKWKPPCLSMLPLLCCPVSIAQQGKTHVKQVHFVGAMLPIGPASACAGRETKKGLGLPICFQPLKRLSEAASGWFDRTSRLHAHFNILPHLLGLGMLHLLLNRECQPPQRCRIGPSSATLYLPSWTGNWENAELEKCCVVTVELVRAVAKVS